MPVPERYRLLDRIGAGGLGMVHRVEDRATGRVLALKVIPRQVGGGNLRGEFLALARLEHPNIVRVFDYGVTPAGQDYFTMEYVEGPPLLEAVPQVPSPAFYQLVGGVLRALAFLHARGMVHADIKPSNILVDAALLAADPARAARLCDFGLAAAERDPSAQAARGTFPYAAPEVYAGRLDARSDLYALGVVLYQMVCGALPWPGDDLQEVLRAQRRGPPPDPATLRSDLPPGLGELICALLDPAPGARPQTADEVLGRINEIAGTDFAIADSRPLVSLGGLLVGRERDLGELQRMWKEAGAGRGWSALVAGEEGIGKSRLASELALGVRLEGGRVIWSAASPGDAPLAGVAELVRALVAEARDRPEAISGEQRAALAPLLGGPAGAAAPASRFAVAEAVTRVLQALSERQPVLVVVEDAHRADPASAELLGYVARAVAESRALLVITALSDAPPPGDATVDLLARAVANAERGARLDLAPLDRQGVMRLVEQAFGRGIAERLGADLARACGGNPAHLARALEALVARGTLARERGSWVLRDERPTIEPPPDATAAAIARAAQLPDDGRLVLRLAAVLGESFAGDDLAALAAGEQPPLPPATVDAALAEAAHLRLVEADATAGSFRFAHAGLAEALAEELSADARRAVHARAADRLSAAAGQVAAAAIARHRLAVDPRAADAVEPALRAAADAAAAGDHHGALAWYERVRPLITDAAGAAAVDERMGDLRGLLGQVAAACADYQRAHDATGDQPAAHIAVALRLAELRRRVGEGDAALALLMAALDEARRHRLGGAEGRCQLRIGWVLMYRAEYLAAMEHAVAGELVARSGNDLATCAELGRLMAAIDIYRGDSRSALTRLDRALADAEPTGDDLLLAGVLHEIGRAAIQAGDWTRAIDALEKAIATAERRGDVQQAAKSLNNLGAACYFQGDWQRARASWERFRRLCERLDEQTELVNGLNNLGLLYRELGQFDQAREILERGARVADATGHAHMACMVMGNRGEVLFREGDLAGARELYRRALAEFERIGAGEDVVETKRRLCEVDIAAGSPREAIERCVEAAREARDGGNRLEEGILHRVGATALRLTGDLDSAEWFVGKARDILTGLGSRYELAKLDLEEAEVAAARGRAADADQLLTRAIEAFADLGARWDLNRARTRRRAVPAAGARADRPRPTVGLDLLLDLTQASGNLEVGRLLEIALDRLLDLTRFERGFILLLDPEGRPSERLRRVRPGARGFERDEAEFSGTIVRKVAASGEAVSVSDVGQEADLRQQKSVVALGLRQIMCAPMRARGRVIGIVYIDSRRLSFEEDHGVDLAFLEAFAAQLSLAIENARMIGEEGRQSELLAVLAHEVRNPLSGILGYSDMGETGGFNAEATDLFGHIRRDAVRLKRLVDNVLELARHDAGNVDWSMTPVDMGALLEEAAASYRPQCELRKIELVVDKRGLDRQALGNPDRILQVIANLCGNAVKFTPAGGRVTLTARAERVSAADPEAPPMPATELGAWAPADPSAEQVTDFIRVDVTDTGPGLTEEVRQRLFQKFSQGAGKQRTKGVGIGLYISRNIIVRHGGTIFVTSEPGKGATFSFRIPVAR